MLPETEKYSQLLAFVWSVEAGSFSAAARAHDLSPSAISKLVSRLEDRLGVRLFTRLQRSVVPTPEGMEYFHTARKALDAMADTESVGDTLGSAASGLLRVQTTPMFAQHLIAPWLPAGVSPRRTIRRSVRSGHGCGCTQRRDLQPITDRAADRLQSLGGVRCTRVSGSVWAALASARTRFTPLPEFQL